MNENMDLLGIGSRVKHPSYGEGVIIRLEVEHYEIVFMTYGIKQISKNFETFEIIEAIHADDHVTFSEAEKSLAKILRKWMGLTEVVPLGHKWKGGIMSLIPANPSLKAKEIPIESFFHKIVMLRDRLRVMEQKINSSKQLTDEEKIDLQQYVTRCYGSLTSFNILFNDTNQVFIGEKTN